VERAVSKALESLITQFNAITGNAISAPPVVTNTSHQCNTSSLQQPIIPPAEGLAGGSQVITHALESLITQFNAVTGNAISAPPVVTNASHQYSASSLQQSIIPRR
jgi:hypothetical protein